MCMCIQGTSRENALPSRKRGTSFLRRELNNNEIISSAITEDVGTEWSG